MKQHRNDQDRVAELRRQRVLEAQEAAQQRREKLLEDVTELAAASAQNPAQVGEYVKVRNTDSHRVIVCRVNRDGTVEPVL